MPERLSHLPQRGRIHLRHDLFRPHRLGHHAASARIAGLETSFRRVIANRPALWSLGKKLGRLAQPLQRPILGTVLDPARAWTKTRDLPPLAKESFKDWWRKRK
ncbi:MAG: lactate utilization protein LutB domain-containing protein [Verrucomicrobiia bacterium]